MVTLWEAGRMLMGDGARFVLTVEPEFNRLRWNPEVTTISSKDVRAASDAFDAVASTESRPLLVHLGALTRITPEVRQTFIEGTYTKRVAILSTDLVTKVVTAFAYTSAVPTRFFTDEIEATNWLLNPHTNTYT